MSGSVNKVILIGHIGKDPEIRSLQNGSRVCNFSIATSESWRDKASGERKDKTEWTRVVIWNESLVGIAEKYLRKGSKVYIEGALETRKWTDPQGVEKYLTEVVIKAFRGELHLLDSKKDDSQPHDAREPSQPARAAAPDYAASADYYPSAGNNKVTGKEGRRPATQAEKDELSDEIPF